MSIPAVEEGWMEGHELLLRLAGRVPDAALAGARQMLAEGAARSAGALLLGVLDAAPVPLTAAEVAAVRRLSGGPGALDGTEPAARLPALPFVFREVDARGEADIDEVDDAVVAALEPYGEAVTGVWRCWRYMDLDLLVAEAEPEETGSSQQTATAGSEGGVADAVASEDSKDDGGWGQLAPVTRAIEAMADPFSPYRVYLVQVDDPALTQPVAAGLFSAVPESAGAGVEVIGPGAGLPPYQRAALSRALLLWAPGSPQFTMARVFDFADPVTGPGFSPGHRVIEDPAEREALLEYLHGGFPVLVSLAMMNDILDPGAGPVVPTTFRTDGVWIWQDPVAHYLERHSIAPAEDGLTAHIRQQLADGIAVPETDEETASLAADFILQPPAEAAKTAVWFPGGPRI